MRLRVGGAFLVAALAAAVLAPASAFATATIVGQWQCQDHGVTLPIRGARVELRTTSLISFFAQTVATTFTDSEGNYRMSTPDGGGHVVRLVLRDDQGVHLNDSIVPWDWYTDSGTYNLGQGENDVGADVVTDGGGNTPVCAVWQGIHDSYLDYESALGAPPPYGHDLLIRGNMVTAGVPFTLDTTINWPGGYQTGGSPGDYGTARHEFGHTIRHGFDGDLSHFLGDVARFNYLQQHTHCQVTNPGYAFNEGWAEFWAGDTSPCHADDPQANQNVEGDVAAALAQLQAHCNDSRADMVHALQDFPAAIHSFSDFQARLQRCVPTATPSSPPASVGGFAVEPPGAIAAVIHYLRSRRTHTQHLIATLGGDYRSLLRDQRQMPPCAGHRCDRLLLRALRPPIVKGRLQTLALELKLLAPYSSRAGLRAYARLSEVRQIAVQRRLVGVFARQVRRIDAIALHGARSAILPFLRRDHSGFARGLSATLRGLISRASHGQLDVDLLNLGAPPGSRTRRTKTRVFAAPAPFGGIFKPQTAVSLTCPAAVTVGQPIAVAGTVSGAPGGETVTVTYTHGSASGPVLVTHTVTTDSSGGFTDSAPADSAGQWQVQAGYAGDGNYLASSSQPCATNVSAPPAQTSLTLTCPAKASAKTTLTVSGALTPAAGGAPIKITYTEPNGTILDTATTDASGNYTDSTAAISSGTWTIQASYAGDAGHEPSTSPTCTTNVQ